VFEYVIKAQNKGLDLTLAKKRDSNMALTEYKVIVCRYPANLRSNGDLPSSTALLGESEHQGHRTELRGGNVCVQSVSTNFYS